MAIKKVSIISDDDKMYLDMISKMNTCELLTEVLHRPEILTDKDKRYIRTAIRRRARRMGINI